MVMETVGQRLRRMRKTRGFTLQSLAERAGVAFSTISHAEITDLDMRISTATKIAKAMGVSLDEIAGIEQPNTETSDGQIGAKYSNLHQTGDKFQDLGIREHASESEVSNKIEMSTGGHLTDVKKPITKADLQEPSGKVGFLVAPFAMESILADAEAERMDEATEKLAVYAALAGVTVTNEPKTPRTKCPCTTCRKCCCREFGQDPDFCDHSLDGECLCG
jgi:transcriptional regulator with XRE-family HTH domain